MPPTIPEKRKRENAHSTFNIRFFPSKMVNVNSQIPFNLHNQRLDPSSSSRSARSLSGGYPHPQTEHSNQNSRRPSPSPAPSLQMSGSSNSIHPGDVASVHQSLEQHEPRKPLLNVRLVRGVGIRRAS